MITPETAWQGDALLGCNAMLAYVLAIRRFIVQQKIKAFYNRSSVK